MKQFLTSFICSVFLITSVICQTQTIKHHDPASKKELEKYLTNLPFTMPDLSVPVFPERQMNILEYGAVADGKTLNTEAFSRAIDACAEQGGGTVVVPPGTWLTGPIRLKSNINLRLERGALVQFSNRIEDFPLIAGFDGKSRRYIVTPPIHAYRAENIAITGEGIFDGAGEVWRYVKKEKQTERQWKDLTSSGGVVSPDGKQWWPSQEAMDGEKYLAELEKSGKNLTAADYAKAREFMRPDMVRLVQCNGILLDGPMFRNSPRFHVYPVQSENIIVRNIKIQTDWSAQNGDGLDFGACRNILVYNTTVDVGDDAICLKPGSIADKQKPGPSCENIVIADCIVYHGHGGFVIGSGSRGGTQNVMVRNCVFIGTDVGLRFKSLRGNGGLIKNIYAENIQMRNIMNEAIIFDMYYGGLAPEETASPETGEKRVEPVTALTPQFEDFYIKNIVCNGAKRAVLINGLPEMPVKNIHIEDVHIASEQGALLIDAEGISLKRAEILPKAGPVVSIVNSRNIELAKVTYPRNAETFLTLRGAKTENIKIEDTDLSFVKKEIDLGKEVSARAVIRK
jgi:polygalacturonase